MHKPSKFTTLGEMYGVERLSMHCHAILPEGRFCNHSAPLDIQKLADRFGWDFDIVARRAEFLAAFRCSKCGSKEIGIILSPVNTSGGGDWRAS